MSDSKMVSGALPVGTIVKSDNDRYLVEEVLGAGGFGITYRVTRLSDGKVCAMKEFFPDKMCERGENNTMSYLKTNSNAIETGIDNFITEAERLNRENVSHPNIVEVDEVFEANNTAYYVMEYIDGKNLRQWVKGHKAMSVNQTLSVIRPVLQALSLLHKKKLTHLDIKHENIILTNEADGSLRPVLIDFGQSKHYDKKGNATSQLTNAGCSDGFAPQEQYQGLTKFTPQADVYAVCATMLFLLSGRQPVKSSEMTEAKIREMIGGKVSQNVLDAIIKGMKANKDDRTQSVDQLASDLGLDISDMDHDGNVTRLLDIKQKPSFDFKKFIKPLIIAVACGGVVYGIIALVNHQSTSNNDIAVVTVDSVTEEYTDSVTMTPAGNLTPEQPIQAETPLAEEPQKVKVADNSKDTEAEKKKKEEEAKAKAEQAAKEEAKKKEEAMKQNIGDNQTLKPEKPKQETNDQLFAKAKTISDLQALADKGYAKAYAPLAEKYFAARNWHSADRYLRKAISSGVGVSQARQVADRLDKIGFYDNGENGGKP
ncbi:MAG: serine/threonine protein kinase [Muribaculaceae bacterium]|nr:serine/threonine protein kinase [Muribaculaceae bacterium]